MRKVWVLCLAALILLFPACLYAQVAKIIDCKGSVSVKQEPSGAWQEAHRQMLLSNEAEIRTASMSECTLAFDEELKNIVTVKEDTLVKIESISPGALFLGEGRVFSLIENIPRGETFRIKTPTAVAGARGTAWLTEYIGGNMQVLCFDDVVSVEGIDAQGNLTEVREVVVGSGLAVATNGVLGDLFTVTDNQQKEFQEIKGNIEEIRNIQAQEDDSTEAEKDIKEIIKEEETAKEISPSS